MLASSHIAVPVPRFGDLDEKETKKYFEKFVEKYNAGELPEKMYKGIAFRCERENVSLDMYMKYRIYYVNCQ